jgi:hypothetical protein
MPKAKIDLNVKVIALYQMTGGEAVQWHGSLTVFYRLHFSMVNKYAESNSLEYAIVWAGDKEFLRLGSEDAITHATTRWMLSQSK